MAVDASGFEQTKVPFEDKKANRGLSYKIDVASVPDKTGIDRNKAIADLFLKLIQKELITMGENAVGGEATGVVFFNTDYEGDINKNGATAVDIYVDGQEQTVRDYAIEAGIVPENISGSKITITVTKDQAMNELLDGYEVFTIPTKVLVRRMMIMVRKIAKTLDADALRVLQASSNVLKAGGKITKSNAYTTILDAQEKGITDGVKFSALAIKPNVFTVLKLDPNYTKNSDMGMTQAKKGYLGMVDGLPIVVTSRTSAQGGLDAKTQMIFVDPAHTTRIFGWKIAPRLQEIKNTTHIGASKLECRFVYKHAILQSVGVLVVTNEAKS